MHSQRAEAPLLGLALGLLLAPLGVPLAGGNHGAPLHNAGESRIMVGPYDPVLGQSFQRRLVTPSGCSGLAARPDCMGEWAVLVGPAFQTYAWLNHGAGAAPALADGAYDLTRTGQDVGRLVLTVSTVAQVSPGDGSWVLLHSPTVGQREYTLSLPGGPDEPRVSFSFHTCSAQPVHVWTWQEGTRNDMVCTLPPDSALGDPGRLHFYTPQGVPSLGQDAGDVDDDGSTNEAEAVACGSHALQRDSTCSTDDDGDGVPNGQEAAAFFGTCTGAYGLVATVFCGGYHKPPCRTDASGVAPLVCVTTQTPARVLAWDALCVAAQTGDYPACRGPNSNYVDPPSQTYTGGFMMDGYGWRFLATLALLPQDVFLLQPCTGWPKDVDGDGVPAAPVCRADFRVHPDGRVEDRGQTPTGPVLGDPDEEDPNNPQPLNLGADTDGDGAGNVAEGGRSHPHHAASHLETDEDGDGQPNRQECLAGTCGGTWGIVEFPRDLVTSRHPCTGAAAPNVMELAVSCGDGRFYAWDGHCAPALRAEWPLCVATTNPTGAGLDYVGDFVSDGYGWRRFTVLLQPVTVQVPSTCRGDPRDEDGDAVFVLGVCTVAVTFHPNPPSVTLEEPQPTGAQVGDPDDADAAVPVSPAFAFDVDQDGATNTEELPQSNPLHGTSRPATDDDGDGRANHADMGSFTNGAWGHATPQPDSVRPCQDPGDAQAPVLLVCGSGTNRALHVWDPVCLPALQGDYSTCRDTSNHLGPWPPYGGAWLGDGYGYRRLATLETTTTVNVPLPCRDGVRDDDQDHAPRLRFCLRAVTWDGDNGTLALAAEEAAFSNWVGDPDDEDPNRPLPLEPVFDQLARLDELLADASQRIDETLAQAGQALTQVQALVDDLRDQANSTSQLVTDQVNQVLGVVGGVAPLADQLRQELEAGVAQVVDQLDQALPDTETAGQCYDQAVQSFMDRVRATTQDFLETDDRDASRLWAQLVDEHGSRFLNDLKPCPGLGTAAALAEPFYHALAQASVVLVSTLAKLVQALPNAEDLAQGFIDQALVVVAFTQRQADDLVAQAFGLNQHVQQVAAQLQQERQRLEDEAREQADRAAGLLACVQASTTQFQNDLTSSGQAFAQNPSDANRDAFVDELTLGSAQYVGWVADCTAAFDVDDALGNLLEAGAQSVAFALERVNDALALVEDEQAFVQQWVDDSSALLLAQATFVVERVQEASTLATSIAQAAQDAALELLRQFGDDDLLRDALDADQDAAQRATLQFLVTDAAGTPLQDATVRLYRGDLEAGRANTTRHGAAQLRATANTTYQFLVTKPGYAPASGPARTGSTGSTVRIDVALSPPQGSRIDPTGWLVPALLVFVLVAGLVALARRR